tara:strand:+ start:5296 stop:5484 length:189 start_codon:yes stop_codon:yes gene_type:complete
MQIILEYANKWFKLQNIPTIVDNGKLYILPNKHLKVEIANEELTYVASLYLESEMQTIYKLI